MGVSIIVPAYNAEKFLAATLESVLSQTVKDWELIVVNDGSTEMTGAIAETFSKLDHRIRVVHQKNLGKSEARNRGFAEARRDYEYCLFLDSDDLLEPDALEVLVKALEEDQEAVAAFGMLGYIDSETRQLAINENYISPVRRRGIQGKRLKIWPVSSPTTFAVLAYANSLNASIIMRRAQKEKAGGFDPNLSLYEDWDLWLRLSLQGHIAFINRVVYRYRHHGSNASSNRRLMQESELAVRKKMYASADLNENEKRLILWGYRYSELYRARHCLSSVLRNLLERKGFEALSQLRTAMEHIFSSFKGAL